MDVNGILNPLNEDDCVQDVSVTDGFGAAAPKRLIKSDGEKTQTQDKCRH